MKFSARSRVVMQRTQSECGLACLVMVAQRLGIETELFRLRQEQEVGSQGLSMADLLKVASSLGVVGRALKLDLGDLSAVKLPAILHFDMNHYVVLESLKRRKCVILDPGSGKRIYTLEELGRRFTGVILELWTQSVDRETRQNTKPLSILKSVEGIPSVKKFLAKILIVSVLIQIGSLFVPLYISILGFDFGDDTTTILVISALFVVGLIIRALLILVRFQENSNFSKSLSSNIESRILYHLVRLPLFYFKKRSMSHLIAPFDAISKLRVWYTEEFVTLISDLFLVVLASMFLAFVFPSVLAVTAVSVTLYLTVVFILREWYVSSRSSQTETANNVSSYLQTTLRRIMVIKAHGMEERVVSDWHPRYIEASEAVERKGRILSIVDSCRSLFFGVDQLLTVTLGYFAIRSGELTATSFLPVLVVKQLLLNALGKVGPQTLDIFDFPSHVDVLSDVFLHEPEYDGAIERGLIPRSKESIVIRNIEVCPSSLEHDVLRCQPTTLELKGVIRIVGHDATARSMFLRTIAGYENPARGDVFIGEQPATKLDVRYYRTVVTYVSSEMDIIEASVKANIVLGAEEDQFRLNEVIRMVGLAEKVESLPFGFDTPIAGVTGLITADDMVRIALARGIYRRPRVIVMDGLMTGWEAATVASVVAKVAGDGIAIVLDFIQPLGLECEMEVALLEALK